MIEFLIILVVIIIIFGGYVANHIQTTLNRHSEFYENILNEKKKKFISFKESFYKADLPIITLNIFGKNYGFILDSGANYNYIDKGVLDKIQEDHKVVLSEGVEITGITGNFGNSSACTLFFTCGEELFSEKFNAANMAEGFKSVTQESGIAVHGILGNKFFQKYKWVCDFDELVVWKK